MTLAQLYYVSAPDEAPGLPNAPHGRRFTGLDALKVGRAV